MKNMTWIPSFKLDFNEVHLCGAFICNVRVRNVVLNLWTIRNSKMQADNFLSNTFTLRNFTNTSRVQPYWHFTSHSEARKSQNTFVYQTTYTFTSTQRSETALKYVFIWPVENTFRRNRYNTVQWDISSAAVGWEVNLWHYLPGHANVKYTSSSESYLFHVGLLVCGDHLDCFVFFNLNAQPARRHYSKNSNEYSLNSPRNEEQSFGSAST